MSHIHNWDRNNRPVEKTKSRGAAKTPLRKHYEKPGSVLEAARDYKHRVLKLTYVDGEKR